MLPDQFHGEQKGGHTRATFPLIRYSGNPMRAALPQRKKSKPELGCGGSIAELIGLRSRHPAGASSAPKLTREHARIAWSSSAPNLIQLQRGIAHQVSSSMLLFNKTVTCALVSAVVHPPSLSALHLADSRPSRARSYRRQIIGCLGFHPLPETGDGSP